MTLYTYSRRPPAKRCTRHDWETPGLDAIVLHCRRCGRVLALEGLPVYQRNAILRALDDPALRTAIVVAMTGGGRWPRRPRYRTLANRLT